MQTEQVRPTAALDELQATLKKDDARELSRARIGIAVRAVLIVFVLGYMTWLFDAVSKLDAGALTGMAADAVTEQIPEFRADLQAYAIGQAPMVTDMARDTLMQLPATMRQKMQQRLLDETGTLISRFESDIDTALGEVLDQQLAALRAASPGDRPEEQLDALILGVSGEFRDTMTGALDELYFEYSAEVRRLNDHLVHLQQDDNLTASEQMDRQLLEVWMTLIHKHGVGDPLQIVENMERQY